MVELAEAVKEARRKLRIRKPRKPKRPGYKIVARPPIEDTRIAIRCAFCKGKGKDPWGLPSFLSNCQVCKGSGIVRVYGPTKECAFCGGSGIQPFTTSRLHCIACGGKGVVTAIEPSMECPTCGGSGINPRILPPLAPCSTCKGQGVVRQREGS